MVKKGIFSKEVMLRHVHMLATVVQQGEERKRQDREEPIVGVKFLSRHWGIGCMSHGMGARCTEFI